MLTLQNATNGSTLTRYTVAGAETGVFETAGGDVHATATTTASAIRNGQTVTMTAYNVATSTDPAITTSSLAHIANFAPANGLLYTDYGLWSVDPTATSGALYLGAFGGGKLNVSATAASAMPTTGSASYTGGAAGYASQGDSTLALGKTGTFYGTLNLTANFAANSISGTVTNINVYQLANNNGTVMGTLNDITLNGTLSGASISGTATANPASVGTAINATGAAGLLGGSFYGPSGQEVAGTFTLFGGTHNVVVTGGFGGKTAASDRRLKLGIVPAGRVSLAEGGPSLPVYRWHYLGSRTSFIGPIAQDLLADPRLAGAVVRDEHGIYQVDYARLGWVPAHFRAMQKAGRHAEALYLERGAR